MRLKSFNVPGNGPRGGDVGLNPVGDEGDEGDEAQGGAVAEMGRTWGFTLGMFFCAVGFTTGARSISDNSLLTHIATGRIIFETKSVPTQDIYTFTAEGTPWVVQSWLPSALYGAADSILGVGGIRLVAGLVAAATMALVWAMSRPLALPVRAVVVGLFAVNSALLWNARPFLFGLFFFAVLLASIRKVLPPWILLPVGWVWANSHGTWPLGLAVAGLFAAIMVAQRLSVSRRELSGLVRTREALSLFFLAGGVALGAVGPLGLSALTFPFGMFSRLEQLRELREWVPSYLVPVLLVVFIPQALLALWGVVRSRSLANAVVLIFAVVLALGAVRNVAFASMLIMIPAFDGLSGVGRFRLTRRSFVPVAFGGALLGACVAVSMMVTPNWDLSRYPEDAVSVLYNEGGTMNPDVRIAAPMGVGNYLTIRYRGQHKIMHDDRIDMYSPEFVEEFYSLYEKDISAEVVRDMLVNKYGINVVLWEHDKPLGKVLDENYNEWNLFYSDDRWSLWCWIDSPVCVSPPPEERSAPSR